MHLLLGRHLVLKHMHPVWDLRRSDFDTNKNSSLLPKTYSQVSVSVLLGFHQTELCFHSGNM